MLLVERHPTGGVFQFAFLMGLALARRGHHVELLTPPSPERTSTESNLVHVPILPRWEQGVVASRDGIGASAAAWTSYVVAWVRIVCYVRRSQPDVVQLADLLHPIDAAFCLALRLLRGRAGQPVLVDMAHDPVPLDERDADRPIFRTSRLLRFALKRAYGAMDVVLVLGPRTRAQLEERYQGIRRVTVIRHGGYDTESAAALAPADRTPPTVLFFGGWSKYKGLWGLLDAFAIVRRHRPDAHLIMAGESGPDIDAAGLLAKAQEIGHIEMVRRYVPLAEVAPLFDRSRVCVAPYLAAKQSGVVHLAFSFGRPVVATDVGDLGEVVRTGETGILVPPAAPNELARALLSLLDNPEEAVRLGTNARRWVEAFSSWDEVAVHLESVYREAVASR